jgi:hypothetical protein
VTLLRRTAALVVLLLLTGACGSAAGPGGSRPRTTALQVAAVGDSITEADSDDFDQGDIGPESWAT